MTEQAPEHVRRTGRRQLRRYHALAGLADLLRSEQGVAHEELDMAASAAHVAMSPRSRWADRGHTAPVAEMRERWAVAGTTSWQTTS